MALVAIWEALADLLRAPEWDCASEIIGLSAWSQR
jgi:hypothetical protein